LHIDNAIESRRNKIRNVIPSFDVYVKLPLLLRTIIGGFSSDPSWEKFRRCRREKEEEETEIINKQFIRSAKTLTIYKEMYT
jgi:hypothetical protein